MAAFPPGYSDPAQYGSSFSQPVQPANYAPRATFNTQPTPGMGQTVNTQMDYRTQALMQNTMAQFDPNNPTTNERPVKMQCPSCHQHVTTQTEYVIGACSCWTCVVCCLIGCPFLMMVPFFMDTYKDAIHTCPRCGAECGRFIRSQQRSRRHVHVRSY